MRRLTYDVYMALLFLALAGVVFWETSRLNPMSAVFPRTIGYILLVLSSYYFIQSIWKNRTKAAFADIDRRRVASMCLFLIAYVWLIWLVGFLLASMLFIFTVVWYLQEKDVHFRIKLYRALICSLSISIGFYALFRYVFIVPLPTGYLFG